MISVKFELGICKREMPLGNKNYPCIMAVAVSSRHAVYTQSSSAAAVPAHQAQVYRDDGRAGRTGGQAGSKGLGSQVLGECSRVFAHLCCLFVRAVSFDLALLIITLLQDLGSVPRLRPALLNVSHVLCLLVSLSH